MNRLARVALTPALAAPLSPPTTVSVRRPNKKAGRRSPPFVMYVFDSSVDVAVHVDHGDRLFEPRFDQRELRVVR